jgi:hypothetical protein
MDTDRGQSNCAGSTARYQPFFDVSLQLDSAEMHEPPDRVARAFVLTQFGTFGHA